MDYVISIILLFVFIRTLSYSAWERKYNSNLAGAVSVFFLSVCAVLFIYRFI